MTRPLLPATTLLVFTDGRRDCMARTMASAAEALPELDHVVIVNDCPGLDYKAWLREVFPGADHIDPLPHRRGFGGAIQAGWDALPAGTEWVFHLEDDFVFNRPVPLDDMATVLRVRPELVQMALRRQPWNDEERAAGGIVEAHPNDFEDRFGQGPPLWESAWLEHRRFFTTNPCLYRASLTERGWPQVPRSEGVFTHQLLADPEVRFGYWGARSTDPWVHHIGDVRTGTGY